MNKNELINLINQRIIDNNSGEITPLSLREVLINTAESLGVTIDDLTVTTTKTYSSNKIENLISGLSIPLVSSTVDGKMSKEDKIKLDGIDITLYATKTYVDSTFEPLIGTKGTAFNKNFGEAAGSVADAGWVKTYVATNITGGNGITRTGDIFELGGALTKVTTISGAFDLNLEPLNLTINTAGYVQYSLDVNGSGWAGGFYIDAKEVEFYAYNELHLYSKKINIDGEFGGFFSDANFFYIYDYRTVKKGLEYESLYDYSGFTDKTLVHKKWVVDYVATNAPQPDLSVYYTKTETDAGFLKLTGGAMSSADDTYITWLKPDNSVNMAIGVGTNITEIFSASELQLAGVTGVVFSHLNDGSSFYLPSKTSGSYTLATTQDITLSSKSETITTVTHSLILDKDLIDITISSLSDITLSGGVNDKIYRITLIQDATGMHHVTFTNLLNSNNVFNLETGKKDYLTVKMIDNKYFLDNHFTA